MSDGTRPSAPYLILASAAVAIGIFVRFSGLGFAPIGVDEYYLSRAVDGVLRYGVPAFDCGGYYQRGLGLQYLIAGLRTLGLSPELAPRLIAAVSGVAVLPAIYLIGRRVLSPNGALVAVTIIALSLWEIEISRFGRFYAPFQAIFAWYVVFFLRYTVDRDAKAWKWMIGLTLLGALAWEGAVLLALANLIPAIVELATTSRLTRADVLRSLLAGALTVAIYTFANLPVRFWSDIPAHPAGYSPATIAESVYMLDSVTLLPVWTAAAAAGPWAWVAGAMLAVLWVLSLRWLWQWRDRPLAALGLGAVLLAAMARQVALAGSILVLLALLQLPSWNAFRSRRPGLYIGTLGATVLGWLALSALAVNWSAAAALAGGSSKALASFAYQFLKFPDVIGEVLRPFIVTAPLLTVLLAAGLMGCLAWTLLRRDPVRAPLRILCLLVVVMLLAVGASDPPRHETRYIYFLYPMLVLLCIAAVSGCLTVLRPKPVLRDVTVAAIALGAFAFSEDFDARHIAHIDSPEATFKTHMNAYLRNHLGEARDDYRAVSRFIEAQNPGERRPVVNLIHGFDYYYRGSDYLFVEYTSSNFHDFACRRGTVDRWSNLPLLSSYTDLARVLREAGGGYIVTWTGTVPGFLENLPGLRARVAFEAGSTAVIVADALLPRPAN